MRVASSERRYWKRAPVIVSIIKIIDNLYFKEQYLMLSYSFTAKEYGLFLASEEDNKKGIWLEASRSLDYYMLRNGDLLEYNKKTRNLRVRMLDGE